MHVWLFIGENAGDACTIWICDSAAVAEQFAYRWAAAKSRKLQLIGDAAEDIYHILRCLRAEGSTASSRSTPSRRPWTSGRPDHDPRAGLVRVASRSRAYPLPTRTNENSRSCFLPHVGQRNRTRTLSAIRMSRACASRIFERVWQQGSMRRSALAGPYTVVVRSCESARGAASGHEPVRAGDG